MMQNQENMISVIVPAYNVEKYIEKCIHSLLEQDYDGAYEMILVDDGSTDGTGEIINTFAKNNSIPQITVNDN